MTIIMMNWMIGQWPMMEQEKETSKAVEILSDMVREIMCKIKDTDGIDVQQKMCLQFFKFLGSVTSLEDAAQKLLSVAMNEDKKDMEEDTSWSDKSKSMMDSMYIED